MEENSVVHLVAKHRRDGENESMHSREEKIWATHLRKLVSMGGMDELKFLHKSRPQKLANF